MSDACLPERVASFLHAVRSAPIAELRAVLAHAEAQARDGRLPRVTVALAEADAVATRLGLLPMMREIERVARGTMEPLIQHAHRRPEELQVADASAIQLLVEWCAVGLLVADELREESVQALCQPFAPVLARRLPDAPDGTV